MNKPLTEVEQLKRHLARALQTNAELAALETATSALCAELVDLLRLAVATAQEGDEVWLGHSWVTSALAAIAKAEGK